MLTPSRLLMLALLTGSTLGLAACKKNSEPKPSEREVWLTTPGWKLDSYLEETTTAGVVTTNNIPLTNFDFCSLDDFEHYHADKTFAVDEGLVKCTALYPGLPFSGTWAFAANEAELIVNPGQPVTYSRYIRALTATTMTLASAPIALSNGVTLVQIRIYSAH